MATNESALEFPVFKTGLFTNRNQFGAGNSIPADAPVFIQNMDLLPTGVWAKRSGTLKWSTQNLPSGDEPQTMTSLIDGSTVRVYVDDPGDVWEYTTSSRSSIFGKSNTAQMRFASVGNVLYMTNGIANHQKKRIGSSAAKDWGITAPATAPTVTIGPAGPPNNIRARIGYRYTYTFKDSIDGHVSSAPTVSASTGNFGTLRQYINVDGAYSAQSRVDTIEVYRTKDGGSTLFRLTSAPYNNVIPGACTATLVVTGTGNVNNDNHSYKVGFVNAAGLETQASNKSNVVLVDATHKQVNLSNIAVGPSGTVARNVYRTVAGDAGDWKLLTTIADNVTTTYTDNTADANLGAWIASTTGWQLADVMADKDLSVTVIAPLSNVNDPPLATFTNIIFHNGRMWASTGNLLYWSSGPDAFNGVGEECWPPLNNFKLPAPITGMLSTSNGLFVFTAMEMFIVVGNSIADFAVQLVKTRFGVLKQEHLTQDGDVLYIATSSKQLFRYADSLDDIGFPIADNFGAGINQIVFHRSELVAGLFLQKAAGHIYRFDPLTEQWAGSYSLIAPGMASADFMASILTNASTGVWEFIIGPSSGGANSYLWTISKFAWTDDGTQYIPLIYWDKITVAPHTQLVPVQGVILDYFSQGGSPGTPAVALGTSFASAQVLTNPVPDPPTLSEIATTVVDGIMAKRYYSATASQSQLRRYCGLTVQLPASSGREELHSLALIIGNYAN